MRIIVVLWMAAACFGQGKQNVLLSGLVDAHGANWIPPTATFASPPASPATGSVYIFTDAGAVGACSGGGSALATCRWSGSAWVAVGGGGAGGGGALSAITAASSTNTIANGDNAQLWNWASSTSGRVGMQFGETTASTAAGVPYDVQISTLPGSAATPLNVKNSLNGSQTLPALSITPAWNTSGVVDAALLVNATNTASGAASKLLDLQVGGSTQFNVDKTGLTTALGGVATGNGPPACVAGTAGALCQGEGTAPAAAAAVGQLYTDSTLHDMAIQANGGAAKLVQSTAPGYIHTTGQTAAIPTATLCASSGGACNQAGQYRVDWNFVENGTACAVPGPGGVTFLLTWTDHSGAHSAVSLPMQNSASLTAPSAVFTFQTAAPNAWASGSFNIQSNGAVIQYATGYTACGTGTGTYELNATVTRLQ